MKSDRFEVLERLAPQLDAPEPSIEGFLRRRDRKRRNQRILAGVVGVALFVLPVVLIAILSSRDRTPTPAGRSVSIVPKVDYVIDLDSGALTPLPQAIIRTRSFLGRWPSFDNVYAASSDGSMLAFVGIGEKGTPQIFIAGIDGTGVRQVTHEPHGASAPAWSPDGTKIAYEAFGSQQGQVLGLVVLDVASGESMWVNGTQVPSGAAEVVPVWPQFTPDGSSLLYTGGSSRNVEPIERLSDPVILTVPVAGGKSTLRIGPGGNLRDASNGSVSPDGSLVTFLGNRVGGPGPRRWVANADGTERRLLPDVYGIPCESTPAGTWSPDGRRIVCAEATRIIVIDIATGTASSVAQGREAIWLDDHTLLVSV